MDENYEQDEAILAAIEQANATIAAMREETKTQGERLAAATKGLEATVAYGRRNRLMIWATIISVAFDMILSILLGWTAFRAQDAAEQAQRATSQVAVNRNNLRVQCEAGNEFRRGERKLWDSVLQLSEGDQPDESPAQRAYRDSQRAKFLPIMDATFTLRDCEKLYPFKEAK